MPNYYEARDDFASTIARAGFTNVELAKRAGLSRAVIFRATNPRAYPNTSGALRERTAWAIAKVYAQQVGCDDEQAFAILFEGTNNPMVSSALT